MKGLDWAVLGASLLFIVGYGTWRSRKQKGLEGYLLAGRSQAWWTVALSIMATQASAITFLSTPGQAFADGMRFVQFYFGLPIAMVVLCVTVVPLFHRLKVYTAYEYLEGRFDAKTRTLTASLFLLQRGLACGLTIYAPALVLSVLLGWSIQVTTLLIGSLVVVYTATGGAKAVNETQTWQMAVILLAMGFALAALLRVLPDGVGFGDAVLVSGALGRMNAVDTAFSLDNRYNLWSGLIGGAFLALSYFGTDQSQVQRYLSGESLEQSRWGLLFNGLLKVPMQLLILLVGVFVFVSFQFQAPPVFFNAPELETVRASPRAAELSVLEQKHQTLFAQKRALIDTWLAQHDDATVTQLRVLETEARTVRADTRKLVKDVSPRANVKDADYVFLTFVMTRFPPGLVGLLVAVILCAAMSATASALNALGTTTVVDFYKRTWKPKATDVESVRAGKVFTVMWGVVAMVFAAFASQVDNLIQAVNILGSIFYGPMLGVFLVGFFFKAARGTPVFLAVVLAQAVVIVTWLASDIGFLWYNVIGCAGVALFTAVLDKVMPKPTVSA